ncbi:hypothetical protein KGF57_004072 [Candida theae]|uniref:Bacteriophage T5 Orf172 DNA-binding domain-containing protein n=1 Tax=Candida theae TaxID=1198502 RepID=A0AAD5BBZ1_9ASCO|nr:uncharacterized protein KGF57_004072 [Candida theae]KAI5953080.1 hypothetical protein KGF57_004072 [Candida theae]
MRQVYQCSGTTQKGERCKRTVKVEHGFCSYHVSQTGTLSKHNQYRGHRMATSNNEKSTSGDRPHVVKKERTPLHQQYTMPGQFESLRSKKSDTPSVQPHRYSGRPTKSTRPRIGDYDTFADNKPSIATSKGKGYIYIYTMQNFLHPPKGWTFKVKNIPNTSSRKKDQWVKFKSQSSPFILIKVGMTTQLPNVRIKQWENQCKHELVNIGPQNEHLIKTRLHWWQKFFCLSINDDGDDSKVRVSRFKKDGFYCEENVRVVESMIHQQLKKKYGKGDVYCSGCVAEDALTKNKNKVKVPLQNNYNVHVEWFLIPKQDLRDVYRIIDQTCRSIG